MNARQVAIQAFIHVIALTLIAMGLMGLVGVLSASQMHEVRLTPGVTIMLALAGAAVLGRVRQIGWLRLGASMALISQAIYYLFRYGASPPEGFPMPAFCLVMILMGLAVAPPGTLAAHRRFGMLLAICVFALTLLSLLGGSVPLAGSAALGWTHHRHTAELVALLGASACAMLAFYPASRSELLPRRVLLSGAFGVTLYVLTWLSLNFIVVTSSNLRAQLSVADVVLVSGLTLVALGLTSQWLATRARADAAHVMVQRDTMAQIARTDDLTAMLDAICTMVEKREPRAVCSIHALSEDGQQLQMLAAPTMSRELRTQFASVAVREGEGSCGTAAHRGELVIAEDVATHPFWRVHYHEVVNHGLRACFSQPVFSVEGRVLGTIAMYLPVTGLPTAEQIQLLVSTGQFAAVAIERARARGHIRTSEQRYRSLYLHNPDPVYSLDREGRFTSINPAAERLFGPSSEIVGKRYSDVVVPGQTAHVDKRFVAALSGQAQHYQTVATGAHEQQIELDVTNIPIEIDGKFVGVFGIAKDVTASNRIARTLHERNQQLAHNADHDLLTGLPNRRLLEARLHAACATAHPGGGGVAVVFFDLDGFKPINDSLGHAVGDQLLIEVAHRMTLHVRPHDTVARLSGDEFVLVLHGLTAEQAELITQRAIHALSQPYELEPGVQHITSSAGIAFADQPVSDPMQLVQAADLAMYKAKREGRNNYQWHTADMSRRVNDRVTMRNDLQRALETSGLSLHYQPKFDRNKVVVGIEALARWQHPERGNIPPSEFIGVAEETGQIVALGAWALETACAHMQWLLANNLADFGVAVNISPVQFQRTHFVQELHAILARTGLPPQRLELEITETVLLGDLDQAIRTFAELKQLGVRVSIDDFGTGFSSLSYLKNLPIDKMKIDRSFVCDIGKQAGDAALARAIISMAHNLGIKVVAEGVETAAQLDFLLRNDCDEFQGFLLARPMPLDQTVRYLEGRQVV